MGGKIAVNKHIRLTINGQSFLCLIDGLNGHYPLYIFLSQGIEKKFEKIGFQPGNPAVVLIINYLHQFNPTSTRHNVEYLVN